MTQKTLAEQLAEMQNNLIALDKLIKAEPAPKFKVDKIQITYTDGTVATFVEQKEDPIQVAHASILAQLRKRAEERSTLHEDNFAADTLRRKAANGYKCRIHGVQYRSIMHASRNLHICRHQIKHNLDDGKAGWEYME